MDQTSPVEETPVADDFVVFYNSEGEVARIVYPDHIDLGSNHILRVIVEHNKITAITEYHMFLGAPCGGMIPVGGEDGWNVRDPRPDNFTLTPSINCTECPSHGLIENGRWVDCNWQGNSFTQWLRTKGFPV